MKDKKPRALLKLTQDIVFKAFFTRNPYALNSLLKNFLPLPKDCQISEVEFLDTQQLPQKVDRPLGKRFILDLKIRIHRGQENTAKHTEIVNVEVQTTTKKDFSNRLLGYSARIYSEQIKAGEDYHKLSPVYCLVFSTANLVEFESLRDKYYHHCVIQRKDSPHVILSEGIQFVIVELDKFRREIGDLVAMRDTWCYLLKNCQEMDERDCGHIVEKERDMAKVVKGLWKLSEDELLAEYAWAEKRERMDKIAEMNFAREEGHKKGHEEGRKKVAMAMLKEGFDLQKISQLTGLEIREIEQLKK